MDNRSGGLDRLARSARDLQNLVHDLEEKGVTLLALDQAINTRTPHGKGFLGMLAVFAEFETNIRKERQLEGIAKAKTSCNVPESPKIPKKPVFKPL